MALFGYARVSTTDQDLGIQEAALRAAGCQTIRSEKKSGSGREARTELQILLDFLREGDSLTRVYYEDEDDEVCVTEDVENLEYNCWRDFCRLGYAGAK